MTEQRTAEDEFDRIEREVRIGASLDRVWDLVSAPGWWINDGGEVAQDVERVAPDRVIVHDPAYGDFAVATVAMERPRYAAFRGYLGADAQKRTGGLEPGASTLVEFFLEDAGGEVILRVVESGFATLAEDARALRAMIESNAAGWEEELALAARTVSGRR